MTKKQLTEIVKEIILEMTPTKLRYLNNRQQIFRELLLRGTNKDAVKAFVQEWGRGFRWSPKAEQLFQQAFPNASYDSNIGLDLGRSGTCAIVTDNKEYPTGSMIVFKSSLGVRSGANNHMYN